MKKYEDYTTDPDGTERHPAFGMARFNRIHSTGTVLFQSDLHHSEYVEVTLSTASRKRDLKHDWVHAEETVVKFAMSMSQFASFVASGGTEGVPVTIEYDHGDRPGLTMESRLALTSAEVHKAAEVAFADIKTAQTAYLAALNAKAPAAERTARLRDLTAAISNAGPNVDYAAKQLAAHAEDVVEKSRADIEAMAAAAQGRPLVVQADGQVAAITDGMQP